MPCRTKNLQKAFVRRLPKKFRGATVVRGKGMPFDEVEALLEEKALDAFDATRPMWLVIEDKALHASSGSVEVKGFFDDLAALAYAQALAHGNVNHRVLHVTAQVLVVATDNGLQRAAR